MTLPRAEAQASGSAHSTSTSSGVAPNSRSRIAPPIASLFGGNVANFGNCATSASRNMKTPSEARSQPCHLEQVCRRASVDSSLRSELGNMVAQRADPLDRHFDDIAAVERADSRRGAREDHVARLQRHHRRDELDEEVARKNHLARPSVLFDLTIDPRHEREVPGVELRLDVRPQRAKSIEAFGARELHVFFLQVARGDVVPAGEAADDIAPSCTRDVLRALADDDRQLAFVIDALRLLRTEDRPFMRQQRGRRLQKNDRVGRNVVAELFRMVGVVPSDADDLRRRLRAKEVFDFHVAILRPTNPWILFSRLYSSHVMTMTPTSTTDRTNSPAERVCE